MIRSDHIGIARLTPTDPLNYASPTRKRKKTMLKTLSRDYSRT